MIALVGEYGNTIYSGAPTFFGFIDVTLALVRANLGAVYGTPKSGVGLPSS
jgi:hypothetical protein